MQWIIFPQLAHLWEQQCSQQSPPSTDMQHALEFAQREHTDCFRLFLLPVFRSRRDHHSPKGGPLRQFVYAKNIYALNLHLPLPLRASFRQPVCHWEVVTSSFSPILCINQRTCKSTCPWQ